MRTFIGSVVAHAMTEGKEDRRNEATAAVVMEDCDLDDAELWQVIDSAAAAAKRKVSHVASPASDRNSSLALALAVRRDAHAYSNSHSHASPSPQPKMPRLQYSSSFSSPTECMRAPDRPRSPPPHHNKSASHALFDFNHVGVESNHSSLACNVAASSASVFKQYQSAAMSVLEKGDYLIVHGKPFIKKSGWRKMAFFFNISFEIKDRSIHLDQNSNVVRAEFIARASMQGGRFADGWGSCDRGEKRFNKPNHDVPSTAETRAKTRACQDLLGIGEYMPGGMS